jgi:hypothetical protein
MERFFNVFLPLLDIIFSIKQGITTLMKNAVLYVVLFGTSKRFSIPLTDQRIEIKHFAASTFV